VCFHHNVSTWILTPYTLEDITDICKSIGCEISRWDNDQNTQFFLTLYILARMQSVKISKFKNRNTQILLTLYNFYAPYISFWHSFWHPTFLRTLHFFLTLFLTPYISSWHSTFLFNKRIHLNAQILLTLYFFLAPYISFWHPTFLPHTLHFFLTSYISFWHPIFLSGTLDFFLTP